MADKLCVGLIAGKSGLALTSELHKRGIKVALVAGKTEEPGFDLADHVLITDLKNHGEIVSYFKSLSVENVIIGTGPYVITELSKTLESEGFNLNINIQKFELCKDKFLLKDYVRKYGISTPEYKLINKHEDLSGIVENLQYPCVLKSIKDYQPPVKIMTKESFLHEAGKLLEEEETVLYEEFIEGNDLTVFVSDNQKLRYIKPIYWSKGYEDQLKGFENSYSQPLNLEEETELIKYVNNVMDAVKIPGVYRIDLIYKNGIFYFLEINTILVSSLASSSYAIKFYQENVNRAKIIVEDALNRFNINSYRKDKYLVIGDTAIEKTVEIIEKENSVLLKEYIHNIQIPYKNELDFQFGIDMFFKYLDVALNCVYEKENAKRILMTIITADVEKVILDCEAMTNEEQLIISACQFLNKEVVINHETR